MEPDLLCFLTLITKLRVIRRSAKYSGHLYTTATFFYPQGSTKVSPLWSDSTVVKNTPLEMKRGGVSKDVWFLSKIKNLRKNSRMDNWSIYSTIWKQISCDL